MWCGGVSLSAPRHLTGCVNILEFHILLLCIWWLILHIVVDMCNIVLADVGDVGDERLTR